MICIRKQFFNCNGEYSESLWNTKFIRLLFCPRLTIMNSSKKLMRIFWLFTKANNKKIVNTFCLCNLRICPSTIWIIAKITKRDGREMYLWHEFQYTIYIPVRVHTFLTWLFLSFLRTFIIDFYMAPF